MRNYALAFLAMMIELGVTVDVPAEEPVRYDRDVQPLIAKYCLNCHGKQKPKGDLSLAGFTTVESLRAKTGLWKDVLGMLNGKLMPPEDSLQPSVAERRLMAASIETLLFHVDCKLSQDPGRVTLRRLNRNEYNNTVRDLLGVDLRPAEQFPADDVGDGFDNIGDVLTLPPLLMEKYLSAAEALADAAIASPESRQPPTIRKTGDQLKSTGGSRDAGGIVHMFSSASASAKFEIRQAGEYVIRLHADGDQAGPDPAKAELRINGKPLGVVDVKADRNEPETYERKQKLAKGSIDLSAHFINDYYQPKAKDPKLRGDRNLSVHWLEVAGPTELSASELPESHRRLILVQPSKEAPLREAALRCLRPLLQRAFRRRVSDAEVAPFVKLVELATSQGESFERGMQVALTGVLVSPQFLFRVERDPDPNDPTNKHDLNQYELANRLSYFLWSSMPDDQLFTLASQGQLNQDAVLEQQVQRMLQDPRADQLSENFAGQWLNLRNLDEVAPDPAVYREFTPALRNDMKRETLTFFATIMRDNRSILEFVEGDFTFVNERLARHYGMTQVRGPEFRRVKLPAQRKVGVLGHGSVLTLTSNPTRTSPVKRGKWIMENLLGTPPPDPPADVPELAATQKASPKATFREQLELHRNTETCAVCHRQMDALGFGLENFDPVGRWRDLDEGKPVDAVGELPGGAKFSGPAELGEFLAGKREQISRCLTEKMMTYAFGRGLQYFDRCAVDKIIVRLESHDYRFHELVRGIVLSQPFRKRRGEESKP